MSGSQWERVSTPGGGGGLKRACERPEPAPPGRDGAVGIVGKSPPSRVLALDRGPLGPPHGKPGSPRPPRSPRGSSPPGSSSALPAGVLRPKPLAPDGPRSPWAPQPVPAGLASVTLTLSPAPYANLPLTHPPSLFSSSTPRCRTYGHKPTLLFLAPHSLPASPISGEHPRFLPSLHFPNPSPPGSCPLDTQRCLGIAPLSPPPPSPS